jgi:hypothetical protein
MGWRQGRHAATLILSHPDMHCDFPAGSAGAYKLMGGEGD